MRMSWQQLSSPVLGPRAGREARVAEELLEREGGRAQEQRGVLGRRRALRVPPAEAGGNRVGHLPSLQSSSPRAA